MKEKKLQIRNSTAEFLIVMAFTDRDAGAYRGMLSPDETARPSE